MTCVNETAIYLAELSAELGLKLRTNAMLDQLQLVRYGPFCTEQSILPKFISVQNVLDNISDNEEKIQLLRKLTMRQNTTSLIEF